MELPTPLPASSENPYGANSDIEIRYTTDSPKARDKLSPRPG